MTIKSQLLMVRVSGALDHELFSLLNTFSVLLNSCRLYNVLNSSQELFYSGSVLVLMERVYDYLILPRVKLYLYFFFFLLK